MTPPSRAPEEQGNLWRDQEKRRAALLSLLLHLGLLLLMSWWFLLPESPPQETFLVIEVGTPELAEQTTNAPAASDPAPQAAEPQVADSETGAPQAPAQEVETPTERPATVQEEASTPTETPVETPAQTAEAVAQEPEEPQAAQETPVTETEPVQPEPVAEAEPEDIAEAQPEPEPEETPEPMPEPEVAEVTPPTPAARTPEATAPPDLPATDAPTSTTLPEIADVELEPEPLAQSVQIPLPQVDTQIPEARTITPTPNVDIAEARAVPQPQIEASVAAEQAIPQPQAQVAVAEARSLTVTPQVAVAEAQPLAVTPEVSVAEPRPLAVTPQVSVAEARSLAVTPQVSVAEPRSLAVTPQVSVSEAVAVPTPTVTATVTESEVEPVAGSAEGEALAPSEAAAEAGEPAEEPAVATGGAETVTSATESSLESPLPGGGNAAQAGQDRSDEAASVAGLGAAASPEGSPEPTGAPATQAQQPYRETRERPLAVMIDNTDVGYPQAGLLQASAIYEMPVEGGLTRLMTVYDHIDPNRVGPVRSARDYFVTLARSMNGILVHDGGSPSAMSLIQRENVTTFNAYTEGGLFARADGGSAPYNLYTTGSDLRQAVNRLSLGLTRTVSGEVFRPAEVAPAATQIRVNYSGTYSSGFRYLPEVNLYRWQRNGEAATDASGEAVLVDAVVVANITARQIPNDPAGRLYIPVDGGEATLYLHGKAIPGRWTPQSGLSFVANSGEVIDLTPFKHWVLYAPDWASVSTQ